MKLEHGFLHSRIARQIFTLFVLSALIPIAITALLSFSQVTHVLARQNEAQLRHMSKTYGVAVLDRLLVIEVKAQEIASRLTGKPTSLSAVGEHLQDQFDAMALADDSGNLIPIFGDLADWPTFAQCWPSSSTSRVSVLPGIIQPDGSPRIFISLKVSPIEADRRVLVAAVKADFLWGSEDALPLMSDICVLDNEHRVLFCSRSMSTSAVGQIARQLRHPNPKSLTWNEDDNTFLAGYWELFLEPMFIYPKWTVVTSQPESYALAPIAAFNRVFPPAIVLSILLVLLFSLSQIRKNLIPLEKLMEGTRRIANKDFFNPVNVISNDEFGELAQSFNVMATRLGRMFHALATLSQIDRLILSKPDLEQVLEMVLKHIREMIPCDFTSIIILERDDAETVRVFVKDHYRNSTLLFERFVLEPEEVQALLASPCPLLLDSDAAPEGCLATPINLGAKAFYVVPILHKKQLSGIVAFGYRAHPELTQEDMTQARDIADRVAVALSVSERDKQLYYQAHYDLLTGLPNRQLLMERLGREITHNQRQQALAALLFIDLDRFKQVNDAMGHAAGDQLLEQAAQRLFYCVRETDTVARLGGDEFTVILSGISKPRDARHVAEEIIRMLSQPFTVNGQEHFLSASIGITIYPYDGVSSGELLRNADTAMYRAKQSGRGHYLFFREEMNTEAVERTMLERDLRQALESDAFVLYFQPKLHLETGRVTSAEVLIRWFHPERGFIPPNLFITVAEDTGLIASIGKWVLINACRQYGIWKAQGIALEHLAVNVSGVQFKQKDFADLVRTILTDTDLPPQCLELELTESLFIEDIEDVALTFEKLHNLGVRLAIDDFGTGYSSLSYLKQFPVDTLKVDRSFLKDVPANQTATTLVTSIITMARNLDKNVVVEGVETKEQMVFLSSSKCQSVQGYYVCKPVPADEFIGFIQQHEVSERSPVHLRDVAAQPG